MTRKIHRNSAEKYLLEDKWNEQMSGNVLLKHPGPLPLASSLQAFCFLSSLSLLSCFILHLVRLIRMEFYYSTFVNFRHSFSLLSCLVSSLLWFPSLSLFKYPSWQSQIEMTFWRAPWLAMDSRGSKIFVCSHLRGLLAFVFPY